MIGAPGSRGRRFSARKVSVQGPRYGSSVLIQHLEYWRRDGFMDVSTAINR